MKKKYKKIVILCIVFLAIVFYSVNFYLEAERNSKINPNIYPSFRLQENYSLRYVLLDTVSIDEYNKCKKLVDYLLEL